jgi:hypothetical protein
MRRLRRGERRDIRLFVKREGESMSRHIREGEYLMKKVLWSNSDE